MPKRNKGTLYEFYWRQACAAATSSRAISSASIGPTDQNMVRVFVTAGGAEIPMDFLPEEAEEIARELMAAAQACRQ